MKPDLGPRFQSPLLAAARRRCAETLGGDGASAGASAEGSWGWAGLANTHAWVDPARDLAALFFAQVLPFGDQRLLTALAAIERAVAADGPARAATDHRSETEPDPMPVGGV